MLRDYQQTAVKKMIWSLSIEGGSVLSLPTGAGKSHIIAGFVEQTNRPILIFTPSKELLEQDLEKMKAVVPENEIGVFSASMNTKDINKYTIATIQSAYKHPELFNHYTTVLIDECHLLNPKNFEGMYNTFFKQIGSPKIVGLTATPYRLDSFYRPTFKRWQPYETVTTTKMLTRYKQRVFTNMLYVINTQDLIEKDYLCHLEYNDMSYYTHAEIPTNKSASDFDMEGFEQLLGQKEESIALHIMKSRERHESILVFCTSIKQADRLSQAISGAYSISSKTKAKERKHIIEGFKNGSIKIVFNVGILTTGFDHPALDCIVMVRPTRSLNLYNQMLGRGIRKSPGKISCTVYDFSGNYRALGGIENIRVEKVENKWNVTSEKNPSGYHMKELYSYKIKSKKRGKYDKEEN